MFLAAASPDLRTAPASGASPAKPESSTSSPSTRSFSDELSETESTVEPRGEASPATEETEISEEPTHETTNREVTSTEGAESEAPPAGAELDPTSDQVTPVAEVLPGHSQLAEQVLGSQADPNPATSAGVETAVGGSEGHGGNAAGKAPSGDRQGGFPETANAGGAEPGAVPKTATHSAAEPGSTAESQAAVPAAGAQEAGAQRTIPAAKGGVAGDSPGGAFPAVEEAVAQGAEQNSSSFDARGDARDGRPQTAATPNHGTSPGPATPAASSPGSTQGPQAPDAQSVELEGAPSEAKADQASGPQRVPAAESSPSPVAPTHGGERLGATTKASPTPAPSAASPTLVLPEEASSVLQQVRVHLARNSSRATLNLHPSELGRVAIQLSMQRGKLSALVVAETPEALALLDHQLPELRSTLSQNGIEAESLEVQLGFGTEGRDAGESSGDRNPFGSDRGAHSAVAEIELPEDLAERTPSTLTDTAVDTLA